MKHSKFRKYSRNSQKLIYWLIQSYSNFQLGKDPGCKVSEYQTYKSKKELKNLYLKHSEVNISNLKPFYKLKDKLQAKILDAIKMDITDYSKVEIIYNDIENVLREEFQLLVLTLDGTFSLSLNLMSQKSANKFINWLFEFSLDNNIPLRKEIIELIKEGDNDKYVYAMLSRKKCCVCGEENADLDHWDNIGSLTYKYDDGKKTRFCRINNIKI